MQSSIQLLFVDHRDALFEVTRAARAAETLIEKISPLIEAYTSAVCPECTSVCCINRHSRFDRSDVIFMTALGKDIPEDDPCIADNDACRFLNSTGCGLIRSQRPYRCTWFFCSPLLDQIMHQASADGCRKFMEMLEAITKSRTTMINDFETVITKLSPSLNMPEKNK